MRFFSNPEESEGRRGGRGGTVGGSEQRDGMMVELELKGRYRGGVQPVRGRLNLRLLLR